MPKHPFPIPDLVANSIKATGETIKTQFKSDPVKTPEAIVPSATALPKSQVPIPDFVANSIESTGDTINTRINSPTNAVKPPKPF